MHYKNARFTYLLTCVRTCDANVVLEKSGVLTQVKDLLTKLLENRPENVVEFIAE